MTTKGTNKTVGRRGFLGALAGLSASATVVGSGAVPPVLAEEAPDERLKARYKETEHVLTYYETNRYLPKKN